MICSNRVFCAFPGAILLRDVLVSLQLVSQAGHSAALILERYPCSACVVFARTIIIISKEDKLLVRKLFERSFKIVF